MDSPSKEINVFLALESLYNLKWFTAPGNRTPLKKRGKNGNFEKDNKSNGFK